MVIIIIILMMMMMIIIIWCLQAAKWVKNMEKDNKLVVIKYSDPNYIGLIQNAVSVFLSFFMVVADPKTISKI